MSMSAENSYLKDLETATYSYCHFCTYMRWSPIDMSLISNFKSHLGKAYSVYPCLMQRRWIAKQMQNNISHWRIGNWYIHFQRGRIWHIHFQKEVTFTNAFLEWGESYRCIFGKMPRCNMQFQGLVQMHFWQDAKMQYAIPRVSADAFLARCQDAICNSKG